MDKKCFTFCAVGRLVEQKGFDRLLEAAACLKQEGEDFEVLIFGEGVRERGECQGFFVNWFAVPG